MLPRVIPKVVAWGAALVVTAFIWIYADGVLRHVWTQSLVPRGGRIAALLDFFAVGFPVCLLVGWLSSRWPGPEPLWPLGMGAAAVFVLVVQWQVSWFAQNYLFRPDRITQHTAEAAFLFMPPAAVLALGNWLGAATWQSRPRVWAGTGALLIVLALAVAAFVLGWEIFFPQKGIQWETRIYAIRHQKEIEQQFLDALGQRQAGMQKTAYGRSIFCNIGMRPFEIHGSKAQGEPTLSFHHPHRQQHVIARFRAVMQRRGLRWQVTGFTLAKIEPY